MHNTEENNSTGIPFLDIVILPQGKKKDYSIGGIHCDSVSDSDNLQFLHLLDVNCSQASSL
jgi:hypothetical protein